MLKTKSASTLPLFQACLAVRDVLVCIVLDLLACMAGCKHKVFSNFQQLARRNHLTRHKVEIDPVQQMRETIKCSSRGMVLLQEIEHKQLQRPHLDCAAMSAGVFFLACCC